MKHQKITVVTAMLTALKCFGNQPNTPKNILFLMCDDLKPLLNCYGDCRAITPNFDRLAERGFVFDNAFCQYPVCGPSRLSMLTGLRPTTSSAYENTQEQMWPETVRNIPSLPAYFKQNGYYTVSIGKVYHSPKETDLDSWSEPPVAFANHVYLLPKNRAKQEEFMRQHNAGAPWEEIGPKMLVACTEDADVADNEYMPGKHTDIAISKLRELADKKEPFFMGLGWSRPHYPFNAPKKYWNLYDREKIEVSGLEHIVPPENERVLRQKNWEVFDYGDVEDGPIDSALQKRMMHGYMACVSYVDAQLGRVLDELQQLGIAGQTVIVLIGDHGFHLGEHGLWGKFTHLEESARSPLIVADPGNLRAGSHISELVEFVDIYPSFCEMAGLPVPGHCEGSSLVPLMNGNSKHWKRAVFTQYNLGNAWGTSMRTEQYRYTEFIHPKTGKVQALSLYDLVKDPGSGRNFAYDDAYRPVVKQLHEQWLGGWQKQKEEMKCR
ncbi:MAG: sulfatase [Kiritimatiellales bacterium]